MIYALLIRPSHTLALPKVSPTLALLPFTPLPRPEVLHLRYFLGVALKRHRPTPLLTGLGETLPFLYSLPYIHVHF